MAAICRTKMGMSELPDFNCDLAPVVPDLNLTNIWVQSLNYRKRVLARIFKADSVAAIFGLKNRKQLISNLHNAIANLLHWPANAAALPTVTDSSASTERRQERKV